jgi:hypothetical protein
VYDSKQSVYRFKFRVLPPREIDILYKEDPSSPYDKTEQEGTSDRRSEAQLKQMSNETLKEKLKKVIDKYEKLRTPEQMDKIVAVYDEYTIIRGLEVDDETQYALEQLKHKPPKGLAEDS